MQLNIQKPNANGTIDFINDIEIVNVNGKNYEITYSFDEVEDLYSLPNNDKHMPYTCKPKTLITDKMKPVIRQYWSIYKKGDVVIGKIIDNIFHVER